MTSIFDRSADRAAPKPQRRANGLADRGLVADRSQADDLVIRSLVTPRPGRHDLRKDSPDRPIGEAARA